MKGCLSVLVGTPSRVRPESFGIGYRFFTTLCRISGTDGGNGLAFKTIFILVLTSSTVNEWREGKNPSNGEIFHVFK